MKAFEFGSRPMSAALCALLIGALFVSSAAHANCTSPAAAIGSLDFQTSVFKYWDGTNWLPLSSGGDFKSDGSVVMTGTIKAAVGTAAAPGYTFTGMTGTGIFETGTNILGISTAGVERARIDASGNMSLTSTTNVWATTGQALNVAGGIGALGNIFSGGGIVGSNHVVQGANGDPYTSTSATEILPGYNAQDSAYLSMNNGYGLDDSSTVIRFRSLNTANISKYAYIAAIAPNGASASAPLVFGQTTSSAGAGAYAERMRIDASGNVGIGTTAPNAPLHVEGTHSYVGGGGALGTVMTVADNINHSSSPSAGIGFQIQYASPTATIVGGIAAVKENATFGDWSSGLALYSRANGSNIAERLRITSGGNVGIGTASPGEKLEVAGNIKASGQIATGSQTIAAGATSTVDWNNGNAISTNYTCAANLTFNNLRDGGTYTLVVTDTGTTQCSFNTATGGTDAATVTYRFKPTNAARTASSHTIYTLMRVGTVVYVSWASGF